VFFVALVAILAERLLEALGWWTILATNVLAAGAMLGYFFRGHRVAWREFLGACHDPRLAWSAFATAAG
jgi:hypothetical protein